MNEIQNGRFSFETLGFRILNLFRISDFDIRIFSPSMFICSLLLLAPMASIIAQANKPPDVPEIHQRVTDLTGTLTSDQIASLSQKLEQFEHQTSNQIAVLMIPTVGNESVEDYSMRVAEKNKFGKKGRDNGVLLFIAKDDHWIRIEVGYGLEGALTDALSDQIIRHEMFPKFRSGDFYGGIDAGVDAIKIGRASCRERV